MESIGQDRTLTSHIGWHNGPSTRPDRARRATDFCDLDLGSLREPCHPTANGLGCDAWFDITTASTAPDLIGSLVSALGEIPSPWRCWSPAVYEPCHDRTVPAVDSSPMTPTLVTASMPGPYVLDSCISRAVWSRAFAGALTECPAGTTSESASPGAPTPSGTARISSSGSMNDIGAMATPR
jgi:hypothetical protein